MAFALLPFDVGVDDLVKPKKKTKLSVEHRGCKFCPANGIEGINKIKERTTGKSLLIILQSPGPEENEQETQLVGKTAKFFWGVLKKVGLTRSMVDIQYATRCFPADWTEGSFERYLKMRAPSKEEIHCCSLYTDRAISEGKPKLIAIFGQVAQKAVLKTRSLAQYSKTFWSDELQARVYLLDHPQFFIRGYGQGPRYKAWVEALQRLANDYRAIEGGQVNLSDQYQSLREQKYITVKTEKEALAAEAVINRNAERKRRITVDVEDDVFPEGRQVFAVGFGVRPGKAYSFFFRHSEIAPVQGKKVFAVIKRILANVKLKKAMHYGCSDEEKLLELGAPVVGYDHDTILSEYLRFSDLKKYGLDSLVERRYPEFSGYKQIVVPALMKAAQRDFEAQGIKLPAIFRSTSVQAQQKWLEKEKRYHLSLVPLDILTLYNSGDADVTLRIERDNTKHVPAALMRLYVDLGRLLYKMEPQGPYFDYKQHEQMAVIAPLKVKALRRQMKRLLRKTRWGKKPFNPGSHDQIKQALYSSRGFGLEFPFDEKPHTKKSALLMLSREHPFPGLVLEWRSAARIVSVLAGYKRSADGNGGRLRTKWNATGTRTGRLSSSGDKEQKTSDKINLQNIKRDAQTRNMCIADKQWRKFSRAATRLLKRQPALLAYWAECSKIEKANKKRVGQKKLSLPVASEVVKRAVSWAEHRLLNWVKKNMPNMHVFLALDYGQVEVRVAAQMSGDQNMIRDCAQSDIHTTVGVQMTGWDPDSIKNDEVTRTLTKNVHFGILFGISKKNLFNFVLSMSPPDMRDRISEEQVGKAYDRYFKRYKGIAKFIETQRAFARENGFVTTMFGMVQTVNVTENDQEDEEADLMDDDEVGGRGSYWGNQAINGPVQGSAHQLLVCALANLLRKPARYQRLGIPPMEVHDALYFRVRFLGLLKSFARAKYLLEQESLNTVKADFPHIDWKVPIVVEAKAGMRLGCIVKVDEKTTLGGFLLEWYRRNKEQMRDLNKQLQEVMAAWVR